MLGKIWNYFSPESSLENASPSLQGILYIKELGKQIKQLAEECTISLSIKNEKTFNYVINITNEDDTNWQTMTFALNVDSNFCKYMFQTLTQLKTWINFWRKISKI